MTQQTQFLMMKNNEALNILAADLDTYLAENWRVLNVVYSLDEESEDVQSQVLMVKGNDAIYVRPSMVADYEADGYHDVKMYYGSLQVLVQGGGNVDYHTDFILPDLVSVEIGAVNGYTV